MEGLASLAGKCYDGKMADYSRSATSSHSGPSASRATSPSGSHRRFKSNRSSKRRPAEQSHSDALLTQRFEGQEEALISPAIEPSRSAGRLEDEYLGTETPTSQVSLPIRESAGSGGKYPVVQRTRIDSSALPRQEKKKHSCAGRKRLAARDATRQPRGTNASNARSEPEVYDQYAHSRQDTSIKPATLSVPASAPNAGWLPDVVGDFAAVAAPDTAHGAKATAFTTCDVTAAGAARTSALDQNLARGCESGDAASTDTLDRAVIVKRLLDACGVLAEEEERRGGPGSLGKEEKEERALGELGSAIDGGGCGGVGVEGVGAGVSVGAVHRSCDVLGGEKAIRLGALQDEVKAVCCLSPVALPSETSSSSSSSSSSSICSHVQRPSAMQVEQSLAPTKTLAGESVSAADACITAGGGMIAESGAIAKPTEIRSRATVQEATRDENATKMRIEEIGEGELETASFEACWRSSLTGRGEGPPSFDGQGFLDLGAVRSTQGDPAPLSQVQQKCSLLEL